MNTFFMLRNRMNYSASWGRLMPFRSWVIFLFCISAAAAAQSDLAVSPVGVWQTIDDKTGRAKAIVHITQSEGRIMGKIIKLINPQVPDPVCEKCTNERKMAKIIGMTILRNFHANDDDPMLWEGGEILNPESGEVYKVYLRLRDEGQKLEVRSYIGLSAIEGRTQIWERQD